jgi:hypothetical protein
MKVRDRDRDRDRILVRVRGRVRVRMSDPKLTRNPRAAAVRGRNAALLCDRGPATA